MPMIPKESASAYTRGAIVLDLGDLQRQGEAIIERARREADEILENARLQRDRLLKGASEYGRTEGYAQGRLEGLEEGRAEGRAEALAQRAPEFAELYDRWREAIGKFESERMLLLHSAHDAVLDFAVEFARKVTKRSVELDRNAAAAQLKAALALLLRPSRVVIVVRPDDRSMIDDALPELLSGFDEIEHAELLTDGSLAPGSCVVRSGDEEVSADIDLQIGRLVEAVLPDRGAVSSGEDGAIGDAA
ncbi:MAG: hypothetical protein H6814_08470 [Phycisphaeraceae bacterium]|nr:hypothetical protein [Phycisphaeraceae bacterium]